MNHPPTPGPWTIDGAEDYNTGLIPVTTVMRGTDVPEKGYEIAYVAGSGNARLISSAPDLLAALIILAEHAQETYPHFESARGQEDIARALDAIAKARRETE